MFSFKLSETFQDNADDVFVDDVFVPSIVQQLNSVHRLAVVTCIGCIHCRELQVQDRKDP